MRKDEHTDAAFGELEKALVDARKLGDLEVADTYGDIAEFCSREGKGDDAIRALEERLKALKRSRIQDETEIANTEGDLAVLLFSKRELDKAEALLKRAVPVQDRYFKRANFAGSKQVYAERLAVSVETLARLYDLKGSLPAAEPLYRRAVSLGKNILHPDIEAAFIMNYADLLGRTGRPDEAAKMRESATALQLDLKK
jgi:tetratricopeptide (TPR) repeat protein